MKKIFKYVVSLLLCFAMTSCNHTTLYVGDYFTTNIIDDTLMKLEISNESYSLDDVQLDLYLGFKEASYDKEVIYGIYLEDYYNRYENNDKQLAVGSTISNIKNITHHTYIDSLTRNEALQTYTYTLKRKGLKSYKIIYDNSYGLNIPKAFIEKMKPTQPYSDGYRSTFTIKVVAFEKDGSQYTCSTRIGHKAIIVSFLVEDDQIVFEKG